MSIDLFTCDVECGCAAKIPPTRLRQLLDGLQLEPDANVIVGPDTLDDAGVYALSDDLWLVQTVDFFPPVARDAYVYGQIAAANALSDVYAMGGVPKTALVILAFPANSLDDDTLEQISRGAADKLKEAGVALLGGHSVVDSQPKYGLSVTGTVTRTQLMDNAHAEVGDILVLSKPLGTGTVIKAAKGGVATATDEADANRVMAELNAEASELAVKFGVRACTDVTGFGLLGHALQMANASDVAFEFDLAGIQFLPGATTYAEMGMLSSAASSNRDYVGDMVAFDSRVNRVEEDLLFDPQTSGGLLMSCAADRADELLFAAKGRPNSAWSRVGKVIPANDGARLRVCRSDTGV